MINIYSMFKVMQGAIKPLLKCNKKHNLKEPFIKF